MKKIFIFILLIIGVLFSGCGDVDGDHKVGIWYSDDKSVIMEIKNSRFQGKFYELQIKTDSFEGKYRGTWESKYEGHDEENDEVHTFVFTDKSGIIFNGKKNGNYNGKLYLSNMKDFGFGFDNITLNGDRN